MSDEPRRPDRQWAGVPALVWTAVVLSAAYLGDHYCTATRPDRPPTLAQDVPAPPGIEILRGEHPKTVRIDRVTLRLISSWDCRWPIQKHEIATLLNIIRELTRFETPKGMCVMLDPCLDQLTFVVDDSGRKVVIRIGVSSRRGLMLDESSHQTYVIPTHYIGTVSAMLTAGDRARPIPIIPTF